MQTLNTLNLYGNPIKCEGAKDLAAALLQNRVRRSLTSAILAENHKLLQGLTTLDLGKSEIDAVGVRKLAEALMENRVRQFVDE